MHFPPYSPDLNPIENIWALLKHNVGKRGPSTVEELERFIYEEWNLLSDEVVSSYVTSINNRMLNVMELEGDITKY